MNIVPRLQKVGHLLQGLILDRSATRRGLERHSLNGCGGRLGPRELDETALLGIDRACSTDTTERAHTHGN